MVPAARPTTRSNKPANKKKTTKKKTKRRLLPYTKPQLRRLVNCAPLHLEHKNMQKLLVRLLNRMERMQLTLKKLDENLSYETKRTAQINTNMKLKKTTAVKNQYRRAKQRLINSRIKYRASQSAFKELISEIRNCLKEIRYFEKKEQAKQLAIAHFLKQWEQDYDQKFKKNG